MSLSAVIKSYFLIIDTSGQTVTTLSQFHSTVQSVGGKFGHKTRHLTEFADLLLPLFDF